MFHSAKDDKGYREVFVNGNPISNVLWANEERGLVCFAPFPVQINKRKGEIYTRLLRGSVKVEFVNATSHLS